MFLSTFVSICLTMLIMTLTDTTAFKPGNLPLIIDRSNPYQNYRVTCPANYGITRLAIEKVPASHGFDFEDNVITIYCEAVAKMLPRQPHDGAEDREKCRWGTAIKMFSKANAKPFCGRKEYSAGFARLSVYDKLIEPLCCNMADRMPEQCRTDRTQMPRTDRRRDASDVTSANRFLTSFKILERDVLEATFCHLQPKLRAANDIRRREPVTPSAGLPPAATPPPTVIRKIPTSPKPTSTTITPPTTTASTTATTTTTTTTPTTTASTTTSSRVTTSLATATPTSTTTIVTTRKGTTTLTKAISIPADTMNSSAGSTSLPPSSSASLSSLPISPTSSVAPSKSTAPIVSPLAKAPNAAPLDQLTKKTTVSNIRRRPVKSGNDVQSICSLETALKDDNGITLACGDLFRQWGPPQRCPIGLSCTTIVGSFFRVCCDEILGR